MTPLRQQVEAEVKEIVKNCPTDHVLEGLAVTLEGGKPKSGEGCACQSCITKIILTYAKRCEEAEKALKESAEIVSKYSNELAKPDSLTHRLEAAEESIGAKQNAIDALNHNTVLLSKKLEAAQKEKERLRKYFRHLDTCASFQMQGESSNLGSSMTIWVDDEKCNCGLREALKETQHDQRR